MSPRRKKARRCVCPLRGKPGHIFNPVGRPLGELEIVELEHDELEAIYLCDGQDLDQEQAGRRMGISRGTVQRLLARARRKMVDALVGQKALAIVGGIPSMPQSALETSRTPPKRDAANPGGSACGRSNAGACEGPRSCPWRRETSAS